MHSAVKFGAIIGPQGILFIQDFKHDGMVKTIAVVTPSVVKCLAELGLIRIVPVCSQFGCNKGIDWFKGDGDGHGPRRDEED